MLPIVFGGDLRGAMVALVGQIVVLAIVSLATSYGLVAIAVWASRQVGSSLARTLRLFARVLPLLLIGFMFLFINAEAWQSAGTVGVAPLVAVSTLFALLALAFLITQIAREIPAAATFETWAELSAALDSSHHLASAVPMNEIDPPQPPPLTRREWGNLGFLVIFTQGLRIVLASVLVGGFFIALGLLIISPETIEVWTTRPPTLIGYRDRSVRRDRSAVEGVGPGGGVSLRFRRRIFCGLHSIGPKSPVGVL